MARTPLSSVDAAWLRMEDPTNLMMVTGVLIFEERLDPDRLRAVVEQRLLAFPRFKQRVEEAPLGIGPPWWVSDRHFDLGAHLHRVAPPEPGDKAALEALVSDLMSTPLDFTKPLWQVHLVDYGTGSVVVARIHHCIADGIALIQVLLSLTDATAEPSPPGPKGSDGSDEPADRPAAPAGSAIGRLAVAGVGLLRDPSRALGAAAVGAAAAGTLAQITMLPPDRRRLSRDRWAPASAPLGRSRSRWPR